MCEGVKERALSFGASDGRNDPNCKEKNSVLDYNFNQPQPNGFGSQLVETTLVSSVTKEYNHFDLSDHSRESDFELPNENIPIVEFSNSLTLNKVNRRKNHFKETIVKSEPHNEVKPMGPKLKTISAIEKSFGTHSRALVAIPRNVVRDMSIDIATSNNTGKISTFFSIASCSKIENDVPERINKSLKYLKDIPKESVLPFLTIKREPDSADEDLKSECEDKSPFFQSLSVNAPDVPTQIAGNFYLRYVDLIKRENMTSPLEMQLLKSVLAKMEKAGDELQKNPEFISCLFQEVKIKLVQEQLVRERPVQMIGLEDHTYMVPQSLKKHSKDQGHGYECRFCKRRFPAQRKQRYISHLRIHSGERPFKCNVCSRGFNRKDHLAVHMRLHTGEKPFKCHGCGIRFTHKASLSHHKCDHGTN